MWPHIPPIENLPEVKSFIGVIFAVTGNFLISVALNIQKNAHNELQRLQLNNFDSGAFTNNSNTHPQASSEFLSRTNNNDDEYEVLLDPEQYSETNYLRSKAWWAGIFLMIIGELGNFMAYAFAPASVVAPLGTVALISNVILAPIMLKERFRKQDLIGILIAIIGAVVVVINSKSDVEKLTPGAIWRAIKETKFIIYFIITVVSATVLMYLSDRIGHKTCFVDLSLVAIFGGYTVLATKSISSMLTMKFVAMFTYSITYLLLIVLMGTAVLQIKFLNKALRQFDSTEVIPTQFVLFTISAIIGSAVLYNDFADMNFWKFTGFLIGCISTFVGVYFITSNRNQPEGYSHQGPNNLSSGTIRSSGIIVDPLRAVFPVPPDEFNGPGGTGEFRQHSPFNQGSVATSIPRRHTLTEPAILPSTPLLNGYGSSSNSSLRHDGILRSLVHGVSATSLTAGVSQALNSVGARHSHALGLDQVFENYKVIAEQNRTNNDRRDYGVHRRSCSVPPNLISSGADYSNYQNGRMISPLATNVEVDNESFGAQPKSFTNSSSYSNSEYYDSEYTDSALTDDDARTISGLTTSTNGSNVGIYMGDESSIYEASGTDDFNNYSDEMDDLPDLPLRRDYGETVIESESEM